MKVGDGSASRAMPLKKLRPLVGAAFGLPLLIWATRDLDWGMMGTTLRSASYSRLVPGTLAMLSMFVVRSIRWNILLGPLGGSDLITACSGVLIGYFGNFALTANAGELVRTYVLSKKQGLSTSSVLASILVEKMVDISVLVIILLILSRSLPLQPWMEYLAFVAGGPAVLVIGSIIILPHGAKTLVSWVRPVLSHFSESVATRVERFLDSFVEGTQTGLKGRILLSTICLTLMTWALLALSFYFIGQAVGLAVSRFAYLLLVTLITLGAAVPALPGQIGTLEFFVVGGLAIFSVDREQAISFAILLRLVRLVPLSLGYVSLVREGSRLSAVGSLRSSPDTAPQESLFRSEDG